MTYERQQLTLMDLFFGPGTVSKTLHMIPVNPQNKLSTVTHFLQVKRTGQRKNKKLFQAGK